jgi:hypothetical protein
MALYVLNAYILFAGDVTLPASLPLKTGYRQSAHRKGLSTRSALESHHLRKSQP